MNYDCFWYINLTLQVELKIRKKVGYGPFKDCSCGCWELACDFPEGDLVGSRAFWNINDSEYFLCHFNVGFAHIQLNGKPANIQNVLSNLTLIHSCPAIKGMFILDNNL